MVTNGSPGYNVPSSFVFMFNSFIGGVPTAVALVVIIGIVAWLLLRRTVFGENVIAVGGSQETAWLSGIHVNRVKLAVYGLSGALAGVAGLVLVARDQRGPAGGRQPVPAHRDRRGGDRRREPDGR